VFVYRCGLGYWGRGHSDICHDHSVRCRLTRETWEIPGDSWNGGGGGELPRAANWRHLHRKGLMALVLRKFYLLSTIAERAYTEPKYINIPLTSMAMIIVTLVLPLKRVKGNMKEKLKRSTISDA
jgi:hypothetical protein